MCTHREHALKCAVTYIILFYAYKIIISEKFKTKFDLNENYSILETVIIDSMNTHLMKKEVKFNGRKHKRDLWMTYVILNSVNQKNLLHKKY